MSRLGRWRDLTSQLVVAGIGEPELSAVESRRLAALQPAGIILFARNLVDAPALVLLNQRLRDVLDRPLLLLDQEGGRVDRLGRLLGPGPSARALARRGLDSVRRHAEDTARALALLGINFNCAPVVDLDEFDARNLLGSRCWSDDPGETAALARVVLEAHAAWGVLACLKHFPGLGRTDADTHARRPSVSLSRAQLMERELTPFRLLLDRAPSVMVSHAAYPALSGDECPASLSHSIVTGLLRQQMGFEGLIVTDDLDMGAVADRPLGERAVQAIRAGCDLGLFCGSLDGAEEGREALVEALAAGSLDEARVAEASARVRQAASFAERNQLDKPEDAAPALALIASRRAEALA